MRVIVFLVALFAASIPLQASADFRDGMRAYKEGAYSTAYQRWLVLAKKGNAKAQNNLGILYRRGLGVKKDPIEAVKWYQKAADQGFAKAQFNLGLMYKQGNGVAKDIRKAVELYILSAENGYNRAQFAVGLRFERGKGVEKDPVKALKWFNLALDRASGRFRKSVATARDRVSESLTDSEIQKAEKLAEDFKRDS